MQNTKSLEWQNKMLHYHCIIDDFNARQIGRSLLCGSFHWFRCKTHHLANDAYWPILAQINMDEKQV